VAGIAVSALVLPMTVGVSGASAAGSTAPVLKEGGSLTVLETADLQGAWPQGIDPGTDADGGSNQDLEDSVFGSLFELGTGGATVDDLATGYSFLNGGKTVQITLRQGVDFTDGTPFNAAAVVYNWDRDFQLKSANTPPWPVAATNPFTAAGPYTVDINLTAPYSPIINSMHGRNVNWIGSPTAIQKLGEKQFALTPVGAGPFTVVSDTISSELVLKKNPNYWQKGLPYLDNLTFKDVSSDESALEAMQSGQAQAYVLMGTEQLVKSFESSFTTTEEPSSSPLDVQMNTKIAPFNNIVAREALYYATDAPLIAQKLFAGYTKAVQGFTAPGGLFYDPTVPGYRTYDLAKAKALVKQAGGVSFALLAGNAGVQKTLAEALQAQWQAAGMKVTLDLADLPSVIQGFDSGKWQADDSGDGAFDPATGVAQMFRFLSTSVFSGVHDPKLDALLNEGTAAPESQRDAIYKQVAEYESTNAYTVELFPAPDWNIADHDVSAPGLTSVFPETIDIPEIWWQYAGYKS
jgi:peptide/nickel transport system substrate-binding protein